LVELIKAGSETLCTEISKLVCSMWNKEELPQQWKESIIVLIHKKGDKTDYNNYELFIQHSSGKINPMSMKLLGIISVGSIVIDPPPFRFSTFARY
jgi:hypothetical protein